MKYLCSMLKEEQRAIVKTPIIIFAKLASQCIFTNCQKLFGVQTITCVKGVDPLAKDYNLNS